MDSENNIKKNETKNTDKSGNSYGRIIKTTGLYGGVEGIKIILGALQSKVLAILLGPAGIGLEGPPPGSYFVRMDFRRNCTHVSISLLTLR